MVAGNDADDDGVSRREFTDNRLTCLRKASSVGCGEAQTNERGSDVNDFVRRVIELERQSRQLVGPPRRRLAMASARIDDLEHRVTMLHKQLGRRMTSVDGLGEPAVVANGLFGDVLGLSQDVEDVKAALKQERGDRIAEDQRLEKIIGDPRGVLEAESGHLEKLAEDALEAPQVGDQSSQRGRDIESMRKPLTAEDQARRSALQALEDQSLPMVKDLRIALNAEAGERSTADQRLENLFSRAEPDASMLDASSDEAGAHLSALGRPSAAPQFANADAGGKSASAVEKNLRDMMGELEHDARLLADDVGRNQAALCRPRGTIEAECRDRIYAVDDLSEKLRVLADSFAHEARDRIAGDNETTEALRMEQLALKQEVGQQERDIEFLSKSLEAENQGLLGALKDFKNQVLPTVKALRIDLDAETGARVDRDDTLERWIGDLGVRVFTLEPTPMTVVQVAGGERVLLPLGRMRQLWSRSQSRRL